MKNILFLLVLAISAGLNIFLYQRFTAASQAQKVAEQHFADCQQVTFQLQNQLSTEESKASTAGAKKP
ncbi:hypothetical protein HHL22_02105 [Hymenobacter sp. RP-2-7]|uniref:Uncharacterized protein n=1 Tax=Hymenobacter polaris TaxID=2682546 RepID=A0A7Y0FKS1_9BACT|nr:hypothetical protein [Hymenobacter polaris]NML63988.1 hypothetical protein [Hymenobacter polaris]